MDTTATFGLGVLVVAFVTFVVSTVEYFERKEGSIMGDAQKKLVAVTAFVHRAALQTIAVATIAAALFTQFGPGFGVNEATIAVAAAACTSIVTIARSIADDTK